MNVASVPVGVYIAPSAVTISPTSVSSACPGAVPTLLAASGGTVSVTNQVILTQDFNGATNNWTTTNNSTLGTDASLSAWTLQPNGYTYSAIVYNSNDNTQFLCY